MASRTHVTAPSFRALEEAAAWFATLRSSGAGDSQRAAWRAWLAASEEHARAWCQVEQISRRFDSVQDAPGDPRAAAAALRGLRARRLRRRRVLGGVAALAATGIGGWLSWRHEDAAELASAWMADHRSATGEIREVGLADGTRLWLNTATAVDVDFGDTRRRLVLVRGEILLDTAADPGRPFVVDTARGRLRALGTRFTVRELESTDRLTVHAGAVQVRPASTGGGARVVTAGREVQFTDHDIGPSRPARAAREAWADGVLLAEDITLGELASELARYRRGHLGVDPRVAELRVLGSYPLRDPDQALAMLEAILPIRVERVLPWWTRIVPAPDAAQ